MYQLYANAFTVSIKDFLNSNSPTCMKSGIGENVKEGYCLYKVTEMFDRTEMNGK